MRSRIEPLKRVARTLRPHRELTLNYFRARKDFSIGAIELHFTERLRAMVMRERVGQEQKRPAAAKSADPGIWKRLDATY